MANVDDVTAAIVAKTGPIKAMKLQKLIYYAQAWHLARVGDRLFEARIEAWSQGPVIPEIEEKHRWRHTVTNWPTGDAKQLRPRERATVAWVLDKYSHFSGESLSRITHLELPWRITRQLSSDDQPSTDEIPVDEMRHYYARQLADVESAVSHAAASSAMEGAALDEDWQDVLRSVANGSQSASDAIQQEIERAKRQ
jgi:uncharacterized phage-associated protein